MQKHVRINDELQSVNRIHIKGVWYTSLKLNDTVCQNHFSSRPNTASQYDPEDESMCTSSKNFSLFLLEKYMHRNEVFCAFRISLLLIWKDYLLCERSLLMCSKAA